MSREKLFGAQSHSPVGNTDHEGLKLVLHRYVIDAIEESGKNLLEGSRQALARFITDKVAEYISRLHLAISRYEMERLAEELVDELTGFGPLEVLLRDPAVTEILVNGPHRVFVERDGVLHQSDLRFIDAHHVERVMQRILAPLGRRLDESSPMVDARLPDGSRVNAIIPPIALDGPCLSIRKFRKDMLKSSDLMAMQTIDQAIFEFVQEAVGKRCNILISGGSAGGRTPAPGPPGASRRRHPSGPAHSQARSAATPATAPCPPPPRRRPARCCRPTASTPAPAARHPGSSRWRDDAGGYPAPRTAPAKPIESNAASVKKHPFWLNDSMLT
ncbi:Flp pilus assembly protein, ATPase CpaF [Pseudomonas sp. LAMO17WK12:I10]|nr:type II/IV secretion system protein [Pseudomonas sp. LAMO17WK12:I9]SNY49412.1 Flp pilus assembly protein, ATPase CpaF [Pseudomonas sp. LAMO17WK12:I10]